MLSFTITGIPEQTAQAALKLAEEHAWLMASEIRATGIDLSFADPAGADQVHDAGVERPLPIGVLTRTTTGPDLFPGLAEQLEAVLHERTGGLGVALEHTAYVGNDINDLACMQWVGWPIAVADALPLPCSSEESRNTPPPSASPVQTSSGTARSIGLIGNAAAIGFGALPAAAEEGVRLSLRDTLSIAIANNVDLQVSVAGDEQDPVREPGLAEPAVGQPAELRGGQPAEGRCRTAGRRHPHVRPGPGPGGGRASQGRAGPAGR